MQTNFADTTVSVVFQYTDKLPYDAAAFGAALSAALDQDLPPRELIVVDSRGSDAKPDFAPAGLDASRLRHVPGTFKNRAAALNAALNAATGDYLLVVFNEAAVVRLVKSAVRTFVMGAMRRNDLAAHPVDPAALVYSDYDRVEADGARREVHLLDWHPGRCRDMFDLGSAVLLRTATVREVGGFAEQYNAAEWYDMRLKLGEAGRAAHIANRYSGSLYDVAAPAKAHNVFDYLLAGKDVQLEMERAFTEHLKRVDAYLAPGAHTKTVSYEPSELEAFNAVRASVIIPVNNRPQFIGRAIESVQAQTVSAVEVIVVVNGGESDPTCPEVRRYMEGGDKFEAAKPAVRLLTVDVNNLGVCFNTGLVQARGQFYVQLDSDDRLKPDAVEKILAVFDSDPTIGMVVGSYEVWTLDEKSDTLSRNEDIPVVTHDEWTADNGRNNLLRINGAGAPRAAHIKVIAEAGWFGVNDTPQCRNYGEDYDLVLRISERYTIGRVWDPIYEVIRHAGGTDHAIDEATIARNDNAKDAMRIEALERRRALNAAK